MLHKFRQSPTQNTKVTSRERKIQVQGSRMFSYTFSSIVLEREFANTYIHTLFTPRRFFQYCFAKIKIIYIVFSYEQFSRS